MTLGGGLRHPGLHRHRRYRENIFDGDEHSWVLFVFKPAAPGLLEDKNFYHTYKEGVTMSKKMNKKAAAVLFSLPFFILGFSQASELGLTGIVVGMGVLLTFSQT